MYRYLDPHKRTHTHIFLDIVFSVFIMLAICMFSWLSSDKQLLSQVHFCSPCLAHVFVYPYTTGKCSPYFSSTKHRFARDRNDAEILAHMYMCLVCITWDFITYEGAHSWKTLTIAAIGLLPITLHLRVEACGIYSIMLTCQSAPLWRSFLGSSDTFYLEINQYLSLHLNPSQQETIHVWYSKFNQLLLLGKVTDSRDQHTTETFQNWYNFILYFKYSSLFPQIN